MHEESRRPSEEIIKLVPYTILILFVGICLYAFRRDFQKIEWSSLPWCPELYVLAGLIAITSYILRAFRWWIYLRKMEIRIPLGYCIATYIAGFAYTLAPGKVGELLKYRYYRPKGIEFTPVAAAYMVERITDLAIFVVISLFFLGASAHGYEPVIMLAGFAAVAVLFLIGRIHSFDGLWPVQALERRSEGVYMILMRISHGIRSAQKLLTPPRLALGFGLGFLGWLCECATLYVLSGIFPDVGMSMVIAVGVYAVAIVVGAFSFLPGGLGGTEAAMMALLVLNGYGFQESAMLTGICRLLTLWLAVMAGWLVVYVLRGTEAEGTATP